MKISIYRICRYKEFLCKMAEKGQQKKNWGEKKQINTKCMQMAYGWIYLHLARPWIVLPAPARPPACPLWLFYHSLLGGDPTLLCVFGIIFCGPT